MKRISFGSNNLDELIPSYDDILLYDGEYLDFVVLNDREYLVTRIIDSLKGNNGVIRVDEVIIDLFPNGDKDIYLNSRKSLDAQRLEEIFNSDNIKEHLHEEELVDLLIGAGMEVSKSFHTLTCDKKVTIIKDSLFELYREKLKTNNLSFTNFINQVNNK